MMDNKLLQSQAITFLRFPLIVGVVFLHSYGSTFNLQGFSIEQDVSYPIFENLTYYISQVLARVAVPLFFFTSGFLFFFNLSNWNIQVYISKLKKRFRSLFIPYVFWISLALLLFFVAQNIPFTAKFFTGKNLPIADYSLKDFLGAFWSASDEGSRYPFLYPFWFIRDLIVIIILSPVVYAIIRYLKLVGIIILFSLWFFHTYSVTGLSLSCSFFFSLGAYFSINKLNIVDYAYKFKYISLLYPILTIADLITYHSEFNYLIHNLGIVLGIFFLFYVVAVGIKKEKLSISYFLSGASFFVFATHEPWLRFIRRFLYVYIKPSSEVELILLYFIPAILIISLSLLVYWIMKKITPRFLSLISGDR